MTQSQRQQYKKHSGRLFLEDDTIYNKGLSWNVTVWHLHISICHKAQQPQTQMTWNINRELPDVGQSSENSWGRCLPHGLREQSGLFRPIKKT